MTEANTTKVNWIGAGLSFVWIGFFIACMFIRTNLPESSFAQTLLAGGRVFWTLAVSFVLMLVLSMAISALSARAGAAARPHASQRSGKSSSENAA
jgi:hypothetical protein